MRTRYIGAIRIPDSLNGHLLRATILLEKSPNSRTNVRKGVLLLILATSCLIAGGARPLQADAHPRIWLTPDSLVTLRAKAARHDPDWEQLKSAADELLGTASPRFTVTAATNSNPVQITLAEAIPWPAKVQIFVGGGTGAWAALNGGPGERPASLPATRTGRNTFTVPVDSTSFGSFSGQKLVLFINENGLSGYGYEGSDWQTTVQTLGLAYQITGKQTYAAKGIQLLDYIASLGAAGMTAPEAIDSGFPSRTTIVALAVGYDWFYDRLTSDEKLTAIRALNVWFDWFRKFAFEKDGPAYGNYFGGHVLGFGLAGYATSPDNPRGAEIVKAIRALFDTEVGKAFTSGGFAGGYPAESYTYGANHFERLLLYMLATKTATGEDLFAKTDYAQRMARNLLYNLKPNRWQTSDEADFAGDFTGVLQPSFPITLAYVLAGTREGEWMQYLAQHIAAAPNGGQVNDPFRRFLFYDRVRPATDYTRTEPTWHYSAGDEHLYRRSSWRDDAVWTSMMGGAKNWAPHQMRAAGHIAIQRGNDYLLVNSGQWKGLTGDAGTPSAFDLRSWRANTLFLNDGGDYLWTGEAYRGGQGYWGRNDVLAVDGGPAFAYMKADLTSAYTVAADTKPLESRSLRSFRRSLVSTGNGVVVLFDRMKFLKSTYTSQLYFHLNPKGGIPSIAGTTASSVVGASAVFIKTLLPAGAVMRAAADPVDTNDTRTITNRVEVANASASTTFDALHVLLATSSSVKNMPQTELLRSQTGNMVGAIVLDGTVERIVLFSADGAAQRSVSYVAAYPAGQLGAHLLTDMTPGANYNIQRDGSRIGTATASKGGVVTFEATGGGSFDIAAAAAVTTRDKQGGRYVAMVAPNNGETFTAPATLRLVVAAHDPNVYNNYPESGRGGNAAHVQVFVDNAPALDVDGRSAEYWVFKGSASDIGAGSHRVWARATYLNPPLSLDSEPVTITVESPPAYARVIDLTRDMTLPHGYSLVGAPDGRVRMNGHGHRLVSSEGGSAPITLQYVDFFDMGDPSLTSAEGIRLETSKRLVVEHCVFDSSNTVRLTLDGTATASIDGNTFRSNMRQPLGQNPDGNGGVEHGSFPAVVLDGGSTGVKTFQRNNVGAGWVLLRQAHAWLIGGDAAADGNVFIGPRVGLALDRSGDVRIRGNYSHHVYFGGWSQGNNFELGGAASVLMEHNVVVGSSWPVRGVAGEVRYNLILEAGHSWIWADHDNASIHHNIFVGGDNDVGGVFLPYRAMNVRVENNTLDESNGGQAHAAVLIQGGDVRLARNLLLNVPVPAVVIAGGTVTDDRNAFWKCALPYYADRRQATHDLTEDPILQTDGVPSIADGALWTRSRSTRDVLSAYRRAYSPAAGSPFVRAAAPGRRADEFIGAVGDGVSALDRFAR
jgi:Right handed beta helix region